MFHGSILCREPVANFRGLVVKGAHPSAIGDVPGFVNDVQPLRPRGVGAVRGIAHFVDAEGQRKLEARGEILGDGHALLQRFRLRVADVVFHVGFHLPFVGGMRFADVHGQKIGVVLVVVVNLNDVAYLAAEGRSSETAEDQDEWTRANSFTDMEMTRAVECQQSRIGSVAAQFQRATMHVWQGIAHHAVSVFRAARHVTEQAERRQQQNS